MMSFPADIFRFILFILFFLYIPAKIIFKITRIDIEDKIIEEGLTIVFGIVVVTLFSIGFKYAGINLTVLAGLYIAGITAYLFISLKHSDEKNILRRLERAIRRDLGLPYKSAVLLLVLLFCIIAQNLTLFRGGWQQGDRVIFPALHDTMWNIALASELFHHFPPYNPAISGIILKNNHYFYPLFLSVVRYFTGINIFDLYFRFGPILISLLFGLGFYSVSTIFTKKTSFRVLTVFLGYFSGNFAFFLPFFRGFNFDWKGNTFFADQPFDQLINPYSIFGFTLMLFGIYCLQNITQPKKSVWGYSILGGILLGSLYGFKSFGGIVVILSVCATASVYLIFTRRINFLPVTAVSLLLFIPIFLLTTDITTASMMWLPGWLLTQLITDRDKVYLPYLADSQNYYEAIGNSLGLFKIRIIELTIYLVGNLGTRMVGLIYLPVLLFQKHKPWASANLFMASAILISLSIPLLFNLRNSTFNIIQFTPYALVLLAIISVICMEKIFDNLKRKHLYAWGFILIVFFIIFSVPVNFKNALSKLEAPKDSISADEVAALEYLQKQSDPNDLILIDPKQFSIDPIYIPAISERRVYLASPGYAAQTGIDPEARIKTIDNFFQKSNPEFLIENKISYIYLLKPQYVPDVYLPLKGKLDKIPFFENNTVIILKFNLG